MAYYLGLDAGGTKTFCLIGDERGNVLGFGRGGTGNYEYHGVEPAALENRKAVENALASAGLTLDQITAIGMGVAGADIPEDYEMLEREMYTPLFGAIPRVFRNDSMGGLRGGLRRPYGVVIACGTGCVCAGRNPAGEETRVGGLGEEFGDQTSGSSIGREGLHAVWRSRDSIYPPTVMTEKFVARGRCADIEDLFLRLYRRELTYKDLEPMAPLVFDAAFEGDAAACDILKRHGEYLGMMVNGCARRLGMTGQAFDVVSTGSVFRGRSPLLADAMAAAIHAVCPEARIVRAAFEPVVGTLLMAMEIETPVSDEVYAHLSDELNRAESVYGVAFRAS